MSMILRKTDREELIKQLERYVRISHKTSEVDVVFRNMKPHSIVKVEETEHGVFMCSFEKGNPLIELAPMFHSKVKELSVEELIDELKKCSHGDVFVQWPSKSPHTVVGNVFGIGREDNLKVFLLPVPKDIERINEEVRKMCAKKCKAADLGLQCGDCPDLGTCNIIKEVDIEIAKK